MSRKRKRPAWDAPPIGSDPNLHRDFGPYRALRLLGEGGSASAYHGIHRVTGAEVAIKVPHRHLAQDPLFRARFRREASLGARLQHPHLVSILTPDIREDDLWLAMAFVKGITLEGYLRRAGPLPIPQVIHLAIDIAEAIAHAHEQSVVHRDLKPANIMLNQDGALVMDFGIARVLDAGGVTSTMFLGTPAYAAPECLVNPQVGPPADRYALGLILFEMLTGHPPFSGSSPFQILESHRVGPLPDLAEIRPETPRMLVNLVKRLCQKDPSERPEDGETLVCLRGMKAIASWPPPSGVLPV
ncbi:serine/threonine-protein kinase [Geothrix sp. PMB-07]|uniref:serine/threonine-protein kinase n=1 Tax=Geothrix sp. PMB-07 TaxID=3068640 RepID=UPI00274146D9|nr:serine/threonine-protein kinase [Geothrix sp. PMB-07]WLT33560.1 serine/threonine-protein kinase [Geothrix sp. PMB-07]